MRILYRFVFFLFFLIQLFFIENSWAKSVFQKKSLVVIAIDAGHSKAHVGAVSARGIGEYFYNHEIARLLRDELVRKGYTRSFFINDNGGDLSLRNRVDIANNKLSDLFISIHHDSVQPMYLKKWVYKGSERYYCDLYSGYSIFYSAKNIESKKSLLFANNLGGLLEKSDFSPSLHHAEKIKGENRLLINKDLGIYRVDDFGVIKSTKMPAVILECGVIVNRDEELLLSNKKNQKSLVSSIVKAIDLYFKNQAFSGKYTNKNIW
ncbi:MAG: N-acetylmuramoyl-L-alanine amidase [Eubacteriaceae bacterium]|nr:N-acetylmuramoyl-L-alanine amidase [Eubacteriaceae bacterium]